MAEMVSPECNWLSVGQYKILQLLLIIVIIIILRADYMNERLFQL